MLVDEIEITLKGGHGGPGKVSFGKMMGSGPTGGNGGDGGDLYVRAVSDIRALIQFTREQTKSAENGAPGGVAQKDGKDGEDLTINLPVGTLLREHASEGQASQTIELNQVGETVLVCRGGIGGLGNYELRSARNTTPKKAQGGRPGDKRRFLAVLKLIADFGLIGLPNAGKSSLLNELTAAKAEVGNYAFTTLEPNLGVIGRKVIADIPGLIEGASTGRGLGIKFLKHIEKVGLLLHCVAADSEDVEKDYLTVREELKKYARDLEKKEETILLTKSDVVGEDEIVKKVKILKKFSRKIYPVSVHDWNSLEVVKKLLF